MGDFMPPGRGCVGTEYERHRRRFERYRQLHAIRRQQYDNYASGAYSQQLHETQMLHKKWLESVASKKPSSAAKSAGKLQQRSDSTQLAALPASSQPSNVTITTKKFKRTANGQFKSASSESPPPSSTAPPVAGRGAPEATYSAGFDHNCSPSAGVSGSNTLHQSAHSAGVNSNNNAMHNSVSVNINVDTNLHRSQSAIKLTFSSTINGHTTHQQQQSVPSGHPTSGPQSATPPTMGSGNCSNSAAGDGGSSSRQNPMGMSTGQFSSTDPLGNIEDFDELSDLLDKFEQDNGSDGLPNDILKILDEGVGGFDVTDFSVDSLSNTSGLACSRENMSVNNAAPRYGPGGSVGFPSGLGSMSNGNAPAFGPLGGSTKIQESCNGLMQTPTANTLLGDTGPAAETLKQMAAQHQNQANAMNRQYSSSNVYGDGFSAVPFPAGTPRLPRYPLQQYPVGYAMPSSMYHCDGRFGYGSMDSTMGGGMGRTMPMDNTRYPVQSGGLVSQTPTSLQRLENQVQSHFAPGNSSTSNSVPSADIPHFRMEQSQRIDVRGSQMAVAQQQSFSMSMDGGISSGSNLPGAQNVYHRYPQPAGYRQTYPGAGAAAPLRMMSAGYQNMAHGVTPGGMQQCSGSVGTMGRPQQIASSDMGAAAARVSLPAGNGSTAQARQVPGHGSPAVVPLLSAKVESVSGGYVTAEQGVSINHDVKSSNMLESSMSSVPSSMTNTASGVKGVVQRSPYMPGNVGEGNYPQTRKWMPHNMTGSNHAVPAGDMRNSYASSYGMSDSMQSGTVGQLGMMNGANPMDFQNSPRWAVSMSQSQSMFVNNGGSMPNAMGSGVYHPGAMMDANYTRSQSQHSGYGQGIGFFNSGPTGMMVPVGPGDVMSRPSAELMHRGAPMGGNGSQNVEYDVFHGNRGPSLVPEFACIEDVFMGK